jgi:hypothetical protein
MAEKIKVSNPPTINLFPTPPIVNTPLNHIVEEEGDFNG